MLAFLVLLAAAILETTIGPVVGVLGVIPDLVLVLVVSWGLVRGSEEGMIWGLLGGLSLDLLSGTPVGTHCLILTLIGFVAGIGRQSPFQSRFLVPLFAITIATLAYTLSIALILRLAGWPLAISPALLDVVVASIITNGIIMPFVYFAVARLYEARGGMKPSY